MVAMAVLTVLLLCALAFAYADANLLTNGNFEQAPTSGSTLPGWEIRFPTGVKLINSNQFSVPEGKRAVELISKEAILVHYVPTNPDKQYVLTFRVGDAGDSCVGKLGVVVVATKPTLGVNYESQGKGGSKLVTFKFSPVSTMTEIEFFSLFPTTTKDGFLCGPVIDDVNLVEA